jgi:hypothetical protein
MNPLWALFFKDRFKTPFSVYKMSFAELIFLASLIAGAGYGLGKGVRWILDFENAPVVTE